MLEAGELITGVELPPPRWAQAFADAENPMQQGISRPGDDGRERLRAERSGPAMGHGTGNNRGGDAATQPNATTESSTRPADEFVSPRDEGEFNFGASGTQRFGSVIAVGTPMVAALVLDQAGHVLLPVFLTKEAVGDRPLNVVDSAGEIRLGQFVASDRQSRLTVLQLDRPTGKPLTLAGARPAEGSLLMLLALSGESGRLSVWTGESQDWGMAVGVDGTIRGFVRGGQFLSADAMRPLAEELVRNGAIHRAVLGVWISEASGHYGNRVLRIERVRDNSAAAAAGLKAGDIICSFAGVSVSDLASFSAAIAETNGQAELRILRDDHSLRITVELIPQ